MKKFKRFAALLMSALMVCALPVVAFADDIPEVDTTGATVYHARFGTQMTTADGVTWMQRIGYFHEDDTETFTEAGLTAPEFTDVEIKGNGTYTVSMTSSEIGDNLFTQLQVSTDIPKYDGSPITFSDLIVSINDKEIANYSDVIVDDDAYAHDLCCLIAFNHWRPACNDDTSLVGVDSLSGLSGDITISMTFTVSGFDVDDPDAQPETEPETEEVTTASSAEKPTQYQGQTTTAAAEESDGLPTGAIVGIIAGVVVVIAVIVIVAVSKKKK